VTTCDGDQRQACGSERRDEADAAHWEDDKDRDAPPKWEWGVAFFGLVLVLGVLGFIAYQAVVGDDSPPNVTVHADAILALDHGYLVQIRAINQGGSTAAQLAVEGELTGENGRVETSDMVIDYVPSHSYHKGGLFFSQDPRKFPLRLRAKGYAEP
jgi:uncharacterized protein (TIGR02588 family)